MVSWGKAARGIALGVGVVAVAAGCNSGDGSSNATKSVSATAAVAADVPAGFDACNIPQSVVQSEELKNKGVDSQDGAGGIKWRGCRWIQPDGYSATIDTTNITLAMVRSNKDFSVDEEVTVAGRSALTSHVAGQDPHADCVINVEIKGGSIEISIDNPPTRRKSGDQNSCGIAKRLAGEIAPAIPASL
ncbi:hypothetical protein B7C42_08297 [Nocardia cerradoensis]|uniref:DUF3558 domain-containing protein n=2 Tax=Nocardia cerradoensis TaxID=85688 RepID=A0A231GSN6_9NOCA|nr:hypothetical protein B7C42_08297 [Nocardia cerradoensis]